MSERKVYMIREKTTGEFVGGDGSFKKARIFNLKNHASASLKSNFNYYWSHRNLKKEDFEIIECTLTMPD